MSDERTIGPVRPLLITLAQLEAAAKPVPWWAAHGLVPYVFPVDLDPYHAQPAGKVEATVSAIAALSPPGFLIEWRCYSPDFPGPLPKLPEPVWQTFLANLTALSASLRKHGGAGLVIDGEYYPATPNLSGGLMPKLTWSAPGAEARGGVMAHVLGARLTLGLMVAAVELQRVPGLRNFWRGAWHITSAPYRFLLAEDYVGGADPKHQPVLGAHYLPGGWVKQGHLHPNGAWLWDPGALLLR